MAIAEAQIRSRIMELGRDPAALGEYIASLGPEILSKTKLGYGFLLNFRKTLRFADRRLAGLLMEQEELGLNSFSLPFRARELIAGSDYACWPGTFRVTGVTILDSREMLECETGLDSPFVGVHHNAEYEIRMHWYGARYPYRTRMLRVSKFPLERVPTEEEADRLAWEKADKTQSVSDGLVG